MFVRTPSVPRTLDCARSGTVVVPFVVPMTFWSQWRSSTLGSIGLPSTLSAMEPKTSAMFSVPAGAPDA
jgi:hypothetical protein